MQTARCRSRVVALRTVTGQGFGADRVAWVTGAKCARLLIATPGSAAVTVSFAIPEAERQEFGVAYAAAKSADDRPALAAAHQLRSHGVASVALHPGLVRTEGVLQFAEYLDLSRSQSPEGVGRAVAALAADPRLLDLTGRSLSVADLAERYRIDVSG